MGISLHYHILYHIYINIGITIDLPRPYSFCWPREAGLCLLAFLLPVLTLCPSPYVEPFRLPEIEILRQKSTNYPLYIVQNCFATVLSRICFWLYTRISLFLWVQEVAILVWTFLELGHELVNGVTEIQVLCSWSIILFL